ncbi:MAG: hypothetical protein Q9165_000195 [Trypethelium subeluteriae]
MFKPTQILQKSQARLRGQRGPAIRILRKAIRTINPDAVIPPNLTPEHATPPPRAWKEMGLPIHKLMPEHNQRTELPEFSRNQSPEHQAGLISWQDTTKKDLSESIKNGEEKLPAIVARKTGRIEVPFASQGKVSDSYPVGYKAPAPLYWNHSIYAYNKNTMPVIPATSATARRMIRLYYNMIPRGFNDVLGRQLSRPRYLLRSTFRAFVADRMHNKMPVDSDIMSRTFSNPSSTQGIKTLRYTFPLYDGVSVVGFMCTIGDRIIRGVVKEKEKAREVFQEAVDQGQQAGLLEQLPDASDVFTTTVGNVPPSAKIVINITYLGELKNDAEVDGIRFTIPTKIAPRYGSYPGQLAYSIADAVQASKGMEIIVDVSMPEGSFIKAMQSPSHRLAVSIGTLSSAPNADPKLNQASASLTLDSTEMDSDFVLQVLNKDTGSPRAMLETHPTIPNQRALAASLVPRFSLPQAKPEIVFIADRSGSMNEKIPTLVSALRIFLKSLPVGVAFNICSFGTSYSFLWQKSKTYDQNSLDVALAHVQSFNSDYGGTNMYEAIEATIKNRYGDLPLEVVFLTDGQVNDQQLLFNLLNRMVGESKLPIRLFTLGIGSATSHALVEGLARAGNGVSQSVKEGEKLDRKVVRMLKGALTPHVSDYSLEVRYEEAEGEDFELVDKIEECLNLNVLPAPAKEDEEGRPSTQPVSLFDANADPDKDENPGKDEDGQNRYSHLPALSSPKILQAPNRIPPLFSFIRTNVYLLLSPETIKKTPKSVILKASSEHGPLQIEIPIQVMETPGETIHQLAAKKAVQELEEGRGWIFSAKDQATGSLLKDNLPGQFPQMVEREAVRLGVQFQVGGNFCSFVAIEANDKKADKEGDLAMDDTLEYEFLDTSNQTFNAKTPHDMPSIRKANAQKSAPRFQMMSTASTQSTSSSGQSLFGHFQPRPTANMYSANSRRRDEQAQETRASGGFGSSSSGLFGNPQANQSTGGGLFGSQSQNPGSGGPFAGQASSHSSSPFGRPIQAQTSGGGLFGNPSTVSGFGYAPHSHYAATGNFNPPSQQGIQQQAQALGQQQSGSLYGNVSTDLDFSSFASNPPDVLNSFDFDSYSATDPTLSNYSFVPQNQPLASTFGQVQTSQEDVRRNRNSGTSAQSLNHKKKVRSKDSDRNNARVPHEEGPAEATAEEPMEALISLQTFEGSWGWTPELFEILGTAEEAVELAFHEAGIAKAEKNLLATAIVVCFFRTKLTDEEETWELVVDKAVNWLENGASEETRNAVMATAEKLVQSI